MGGALMKRISRLQFSDTDAPAAPPAELVAFVVQNARYLRQWKRSTLADFANVSLSTVERVERGEKVRGESLDRIAEGLGYGVGYFTTPRQRKSAKEAQAELLETYGFLEPVKVCPLRTQNQIRTLAKCDAAVFSRNHLDSSWDTDIEMLREWLDLTGFILASEISGKDALGGRRRGLYSDVLKCVTDFERRGVNVLAGVMNAPQPKFPIWSIAVFSLTLKSTDPAASKRRTVFIDSRILSVDKCAWDFD